MGVNEGFLPIKDQRINMCSESEQIEFLKKAYNILLAILFVTVGVCLIPYLNENSRSWMINSGQPLFWVLLSIYVIIGLLVSFYHRIGEIYPINYITGSIFGLSFAYIASAILAFYDPELVLFVSTTITLVALSNAIYLYIVKGKHMVIYPLICSLILIPLCMGCLLEYMPDIWIYSMPLL